MSERASVLTSHPTMVAQGDAEQVIDLGAIFATLWRGKWIIGIFTILAGLAGGYYAYSVAVPKYTSSVVVMLETQQANVVNLESVVSGVSGDSAGLNSEVEVLKSRSLLGKVVDRLDLTTDPEFNGALRAPSKIDLYTDQAKAVLTGGGLTQAAETAPAVAPDPRRVRDRAVSALLGRVSVQNIPRSLVFRITVETENARKSALIADTIAEIYVSDQLEVKFETTEKATAWLSGRVTELQTQLEASEAKVADFSASIDLVSAESLRVQEIQLKDIRERVADARLSEAQAAERLAVLGAAASRSEQALVADDVQLTRLMARADTDAQIGAAFDARFEQIRARAELEMTRLTQQVAALQDSQADLETLIARQSGDLITLQQLTREAESVRLLYETFLRRLQEMSAQQGLQQADSRILSNAVIPGGPSAPRKSFIVAVAVMLGVLAGAILVLLREARQNGFRTARDLESHAGYTVLGQIPSIPARNRRRTLSYLQDRPASAAAEAYRNLRTSLMLSNVDTPPQVIVSTSCVPGEGKTTNSLALAQNLVGLGKKVLLIEGDIRRRTFTQYFENIPKQGLVSVLAGEVPLEEAMVESPLLVGASILAGESSNVNAADLFASEKFKALMTEMRGRFDVIIIDTPPVLVVPDARIIAESADAILFTVKWDSTGKSQIDEAMRMFHSSGQRITGFVLSQINAKQMKAYGYGGRYGAYAGYGAQYYKN